jgi:FHA domain-containing protein
MTGVSAVMAANTSDDDKHDKTQFGVAPPPPLKRSPQTEPAAAGEKKESDETRVVSPSPTAESAAESQDRTQGSAAPPPTPKPVAATSAPPPAVSGTPPGDHTRSSVPPPPKPPEPRKEPGRPTSPPTLPTPPPDAEEDGTVIVTRNRSATATLQRVQPPGHAETIRLDRTSYVVGRSHKCDVRLYTESAHREHARLLFDDGAWYAEPFSGKTVIADGVKVRDKQRLTHKMRLQLGGDELLFFDERVAASPSAERPAEPTSPRRALSVVVAVVVVASLALAAWWLFSSGAKLP